MPFFRWLIGEKYKLLLCLKLLSKESHLPSLLQWEKVSRRRSDGWGVIYSMYMFFNTAIIFHLLGKANKKPSPWGEGVMTKEWRMRWKRLEISPLTKYNACGYTSSASQARHLPLKGKALRCSANKAFFPFPRLKVFGATFFQKGSKKF